MMNIRCAHRLFHQCLYFLWLGVDLAWFNHLIDDDQVNEYHQDALRMIEQY